MNLAELALAAATLPLLLGAVLQRVTGMGFALVAAPLLVLVFGAADGVLVVNLCGLITSSVGAIIDRRRVEWRRLALLLPPAAVGAGVGVLLALVLDPDLLEIAVGSALLVGLLVALAVTPRPSESPAAWTTLLAGAGAGFGGALAGLPGPPIAIYAASNGWRGPSMSGTLQVLFTGLALVVLPLKLLSGAAALPDAGTPFWVAAGAALVLGLVAGHFAGRVISARAAWRLVIVVAIVGSLATIAHGIAQLLT